MTQVRICTTANAPPQTSTTVHQEERELFDEEYRGHELGGPVGIRCKNETCFTMHDSVIGYMFCRINPLA
jgi:hypothetical protein